MQIYFGMVITSNNGGGKCDCRRLSVCLSVCQQDYSKMHGWIWMKCCVSTDVGTCRDWLTFEPDLDLGLMPEPDYFLRYRMHCNMRKFITSEKSHIQVLSMVIRRQPQQQRMVLRRRKTVVGGKCALPSAILDTNEYICTVMIISSV